MKLPYQKGMFDLRSVAQWVEVNKPAQIEMNDAQYAWFANMSCANKREFTGIPIVFTDANV
jgi:hypothetical protein